MNENGREINLLFNVMTTQYQSMLFLCGPCCDFVFSGDFSSAVARGCSCDVETFNVTLFLYEPSPAPSFSPRPTLSHQPSATFAPTIVRIRDVPKDSLGTAASALVTFDFRFNSTASVLAFIIQLLLLCVLCCCCIVLCLGFRRRRWEEDRFYNADEKPIEGTEGGGRRRVSLSDFLLSDAAEGKELRAVGLQGQNRWTAHERNLVLQPASSVEASKLILREANGSDVQVCTLISHKTR